jgi:hypothetical protein
MSGDLPTVVRIPKEKIDIKKGHELVTFLFINLVLPRGYLKAHLFLININMLGVKLGTYLLLAFIFSHHISC